MQKKLEKEERLELQKKIDEMTFDDLKEDWRVVCLKKLKKI